MIITHEEISRKAREIWEREGRPEGRDKEHWIQAENELREAQIIDQNGLNLSVPENPALKEINVVKSEATVGRKRAQKRS